MTTVGGRCLNAIYGDVMVFARPVLKHGPRSVTRVHVYSWCIGLQNEGECLASNTCNQHSSGVYVSEHVCYDPKDGELCLRNVNLVEILMEACGGTDVQIVRFIWV